MVVDELDNGPGSGGNQRGKFVHDGPQDGMRLQTGRNDPVLQGDNGARPATSDFFFERGWVPFR